MRIGPGSDIYRVAHHLQHLCKPKALERGGKKQRVLLNSVKSSDLYGLVAVIWTVALRLVDSAPIVFQKLLYGVNSLSNSAKPGTSHPTLGLGALRPAW